MDKKKIKSCMKKQCIKFKNSLYFKSLKSINLKHLYSSLTDASFLLLVSLLFIPVTFILNWILGPIDFNVTSESALMEAYTKFLGQFLIIIVVFFIFAVFIYSLTRYSLYSLLIKKWHGWKNLFLYSLFYLVSMIILFILILLGTNVIVELYAGFYTLFLLMVYAYYLLKFNVIYFNKFKIFDSLKELFGLGFGFLGRFLLGCLTIIIVSFIIVIFTTLLNLLNFTNNLTTAMIISNVNMFLIGISFFLLTAWLRDYLLQYYKKIKN